MKLARDFNEFLSWLNSKGVEYLLVGGYAVGYHGYPRATNDLDIWARRTPENAARLVNSLREFGFDTPDLSEELFLRPDAIVRLGVPPIRIEIFTDVSGVDFEDCRARAIEDEIDGVAIPIISLQDLKANKRASGRHKDLDDLENLP